eukprot:scpid78809/ scgid3139/ 
MLTHCHCPKRMMDEGKQSHTLRTLKADRRSQRCVVALLSGPEFCWSRSAIPLCQFCILTWGSIPGSTLHQCWQRSASSISTTPAASNGNSNEQYTALVTLHAKLQQCIAGAKAAKQKATRIEGWLGYSRSSARP